MFDHPLLVEVIAADRHAELRRAAHASGGLRPGERRHRARWSLARLWLVGPARPPAVVAALQGLAARPDVTPGLRAVRCPTLVVVGSEDVVTPPADARVIAEAVPGAQLEIIEGVGHLANMEAPERFNRVLLDFLARAGEQAGPAPC